MSVVRRSWFVPEVVQTSAMDCGPASLKSLLEGFGVGVSYGRLREACQTDIDGTSIDALEEVACTIGLDAEQRMVPFDHLFLPESESFPGLLTVRLPSGLTHFVVAWRVHALGGDFDSRGLVQLMDPGQGRRWVTVEHLREELYLHGMPVPAAAWREYAESPRFAKPLRRRIAALGVRDPAALLTEALADPSWRAIAALDAATRMVTSLAKADGVDTGAQSEALLGSFFRAARGAIEAGGAITENPAPMRFWSVHPHPEPDEDGSERVTLYGAVMLSVAGLRDDAPATHLHTLRATGAARVERHSLPSDVTHEVSPEIAAALLEEQTPPWRILWQLVREDGLLAPAVLFAALLVATLAVLGESVIFRALFDIARMLSQGPQRLGGLFAVLLFVTAVMALEFPLAVGFQRVGRHLENRLRVAFLEKIPKLGDRYFSSRPTFDMTERGHSVQSLRALPPLAGELLRAVASLFVTTAGIAIVAPRVAVAAFVAAIVAVLLPVVVQRPLIELDLRYTSHAGALGRFYLDALRGLSAVRTHGAERAVRREHESLLVEWARAARALLSASIGIEGLEALLGMSISGALLLGPFGDASQSGSVLLLAYWALSIPALGASVAQLARQYPHHRNVALRLLEPLGALEDMSAPAADTPAAQGPAHLSFRDVAVRAGGHDVLQGITVDLPAGGHVAVVGSSGAGKSSLVGVLLGWHTPSSGTVLVDGRALDGAALATLRRHTTWVDPAVQLWNRSLLDNLSYGTPYGAGTDFGEVIRMADLRGVLERLPDGMQTSLGEGGALVSGGEGQRVRLARGMLRPDARLVILDEPFRGLDREKRRELLTRARLRWKDATLVCITHDVRETLSFGRVLVIEGGRLVEDGDPKVLSEDASTRYRALLDAEDSLREGLWSAASWRRIRMDGGRIREAARKDGDVEVTRDTGRHSTLSGRHP